MDSMGASPVADRSSARAVCSGAAGSDKEPEGHPQSLTAAQPACVAARLVPGAHMAFWSDPLLELVLRWLDPADLARCSRTCRRWHQAASDPELRARALARARPGWYRGTPDRTRARQVLLHWCQHLPPGSTERLRLEAFAECRLSARAAFHVLTQARWRTGRFAAPADTPVTCKVDSPVDGLLLSPDGQTLALWGPAAKEARGALSVSFWQQESAGWKRAGGSRYRGALSCQHFAADGRGFRALGQWGELVRWGRETAGEDSLWRSLAPVFIYKGVLTPTQATLSPDGHYMAAVMEGDVQIFKEEESGDWHQQYSRSCQNPQDGGHPWRWVRPSDRVRSPLVFSDRARHLVFADTEGLRAFCRTGARWQELLLEPEPAAQEREEEREPGCYARSWRPLELARFAFDLSGQLLCAARIQADSRLEHQRLLDVWRFDAGVGWQHMARSEKPNFDVQDVQKAQTAQTAQTAGFPGAFSPDGQHLAFAERPVGRLRRVYVMSARDPGGWSVTTRLPFGRLDAGSPEPGQPVLVRFDASARHLVASVSHDVHIWQYRPEAGWMPWLSLACFSLRRFALRWRAGAAPALVFSPDAVHCAWVTRGRRVSLLGAWGNGYRESGYREKVTWCEPGPGNIHRLLFTPDGSGLLVVSYSDPENSDSALVTRLHSLRLVPEVQASATGSRPSDQDPDRPGMVQLVQAASQENRGCMP